MIGTITYNPSIDRHIWVKNLVKDDANRAHHILNTAGGKGVNVSKAVVELGGRTHAFMPLGGFTGQLFRQLMSGLNIPFSALPIQGETRINTVLTDLKDDTQTRVSAPGPCLTKKEIQKFTRMILTVRPRPFLWALGGSLAACMPASMYREIIFKLEKNGLPCVLDADDKALKLGIEAKPFMIKPNEYEMRRLTGHPHKNMAEIVHDARGLLKKGVRLVIVSLAAKGAIFVTQNETFHVSTPRVTVASNVGAGDCLIGGTILGLSRRMSLKDAACLGVAAGTSAVMREAPRLCLRTDIPRLLKRLRVRDL